MSVHLVLFGISGSDAHVKNVYLFNLIKANRCLIIAIIAPQDPLQSQG